MHGGLRLAAGDPFSRDAGGFLRRDPDPLRAVLASDLGGIGRERGLRTIRTGPQGGPAAFGRVRRSLDAIFRVVGQRLAAFGLGGVGGAGAGGVAGSDRRPFPQVIGRRAGLQVGVGRGGFGPGGARSGRRGRSESVPRPHGDGLHDSDRFAKRDVLGDHPHAGHGDLLAGGDGDHPAGLVVDGFHSADGDLAGDRDLLGHDVGNPLLADHLVGSERHPDGVGGAVHGAEHVGPAVIVAGADLGPALGVGDPATAVFLDHAGLGHGLVADRGDLHRLVLEHLAVLGHIAFFVVGVVLGTLDGPLHVAVFDHGDLLIAGLDRGGSARGGDGTRGGGRTGGAGCPAAGIVQELSDGGLAGRGDGAGGDRDQGARKGREHVGQDLSGGEDKTGRSVAEVGQSPVGKPEGKTARERGVADVNTPFVRRSDVPEILRKGQDEPQIDSSKRGATAEGGRVSAPWQHGRPAEVLMTAVVRRSSLGLSPRCNRCNRTNLPACPIPAGPTEPPGWPAILPGPNFEQ